jgi:PilZ domain
MSPEIALPQPGYATMRRWPRFKLDVPVRVVTQGATKVAIVSGRGSELNNGGMAVFAGTELAIGAQVAVEFTPPYSNNPIRVRCFVKNRSGYHYGVEFITESDHDYQSVHQIEAVLSSIGFPVEDAAVKSQ